ncbi:MAG: UbiD family decarboxylase domain-containing protein, partial [Nitrososphaeraceae archaeon]
MKKIEDNNTPDLHEFLHRLEEKNELIKIKKAVNTKFEIAAIISKMDGKQAVLFDRIMGSKIKVVSNIVGTRSRFCLALGAKNMQDIHNVTNNAIKNMKKPTIVKETPSYHYRSSANLSILPIMTHFEKDAGPYITSSVVYAKDQDMGNQNSSTHRLLKLDEKHMAIRMVEGRHLHRCFLNAKEHGEDLKVAIVIGVHPAINIASAYQAVYG